MSLPDCLVAEWPAPAHVRTLVSTRGGDTTAPLGFNISHTVADDPARVAANRGALQQAMGVEAIQWLTQVHGDRVLEVTTAMAEPPEVDALYTRTPGLALAVLTADCLPVLLCNRDGTEIAAAHAGWRGLAAGILLSLIHI